MHAWCTLGAGEFAQRFCAMMVYGVVVILLDNIDMFAGM